MLDELLADMDAVINPLVSVAAISKRRMSSCRENYGGMPGNGIRRLPHMSALNAGIGQRSGYLQSKGEGESVVNHPGWTRKFFGHPLWSRSCR